MRLFACIFLTMLFCSDLAAAATKDAFTGSTFRFQGYDRNGVFISEGDLATDRDGKARFKFDFSTNPALQGQRLRGRWRVQNGRFCYNVRINGQRVDACARNKSESRLTWADGSSTILTRRSGPAKAPAAKSKPSASKTVQLSRAERRQIQRALVAKGYDAGAPDGVFGKRTARAIAAWQRSDKANSTGQLTRQQAAALLAAAPKTGAAKIGAKRAGCDNPMTAAQRNQVAGLLRKIIALTDTAKKNAGKGKAVRISLCRQVSYQPIGSKRRISGALASLYTELNGSWHDVASYGLIKKAGDYFVSSSAGLVSHSEPDKGRMAAWMKRVNRETVSMLNAAGYPAGLSQKKRTVILNRDLEELGRPDLRVGFKALGDLMRGGGGSASQKPKACTSQRSYVCHLPCANNSRPDPKKFIRSSVSSCSKAEAARYANANKLRLCKSAGFDRTRNLPPLDAYCD